MQHLFIQPDVEFEKTAGEVDLSEDPNMWPEEVLQELYKQVPYIADFQPHVTMEKVDSERGYGLGQVEIANKTEAQNSADPDLLAAAGIRSVRIPVVIKERKLSPFDLLVNDQSKVLPLTESRLRQSLFRPQAFDVTSQTPGDQSMIGQLYPPYRQNYGFGGGGMTLGMGGMGKQSSALEEFLIKELEDHDQGFRYTKQAKVLTMKGRQRIKEKNFAVPGGKGPGGTGKYPIHDERHARSALTFVSRHGTPAEKAQVHAAVAKKYPGLASRSSVPGVRAAHAQRKTASLMEATFDTFYPRDIDKFFEKLSADKNLQAAYNLNANALVGPLGLLANGEPVGCEKTAEALALHIKPTVVQLLRVDDGYLMKTASHVYWRPVTTPVSRRDVVQTFGEKVALAADEAGQVTMTEDADAQEESPLEAQEPTSISESGIYKVVNEETGQELIGYVIPNLLDVDGQPLPLALFTNGSHSAVQPDIVGTPAGDGASLPTDMVGGTGAFFDHTDDGKLQATIPLELSGGSYTSPGEPATFVGETFDGRPVQVSVQPNIQTIVQSPEGKVLVPDTWHWTPLGAAASVSLVGSEGSEEAPEDWHEDAPEAVPEDMESNEPDIGEGQQPEGEKQSHVWVRGDHDCFSFRGPGVEKLAAAEREMLSLDDAMFLLAALGVHQGYGVQKLAQALNEPVRVVTKRHIKLASEQDAYAQRRAAELHALVPHLRRDLMKEAAVIPDPTAVDTVLSLGFINPENIMTFVSYLPAIDDSQAKMCDLLLASRVGVSDVSSSALERAIRSTEEVIEGLKVLAFQDG